MSGPVEVLFVCRHNAGRSQLAAGLLRARAGAAAAARSAGIEPAPAINAVAAAALLERGVDITDQVPRRVAPADLARADVIVSLVPGLALAVPQTARLEEWALPDPAEWDLEHIRELVTAIDERVADLAQRVLQR